MEGSPFLISRDSLSVTLGRLLGVDQGFRRSAHSLSVARERATGRKTGSEGSSLQFNEVQFSKKEDRKQRAGNKCRIWLFSRVSCASGMRIRWAGREARELIRGKQAEKFKNFTV